MDYEAALLADFSDDESGLSDREEEASLLRRAEAAGPSENGTREATDKPERQQEPPDGPQPPTSPAPQSLWELLEAKPTTVQARLRHVQSFGGPGDISRVYRSLEQVKQDISDLEAELEAAAVVDQRRVLAASALPVLIGQEIADLHRFVVAQYSAVYPELAQLVPAAVEYCRVVQLVGQDLAAIRNHEKLLRPLVGGDKTLAIVMAALSAPLFRLQNTDWQAVEACASACVELASLQAQTSAILSRQLARVCPNVTALVGSEAALQLLVAAGLLAALAATPACNVKAFGEVRGLLAGFVAQTPLVAQLPPEIQRQAVRVVSAKVTLAARVDLAQLDRAGGAGQRFRADAQLKIDRLLAPPEKSKTKALPVPVDQKLKRRGGQRFRKARERMNMLALRQAQNKMVFGKEEQSEIDMFGEEVGLGMGVLGVGVNKNTDARMSKRMIQRLKDEQNRQAGPRI